jgi:hypothetical protein
MSGVLTEYIEYLSSQNENLLFLVHYIRRKTQAQLAVVSYALIHKSSSL